MFPTTLTPLSFGRLNLGARCTPRVIAGLVVLSLLSSPLRATAQTAVVSPPAAQAPIPAEWLREFEAGVPDKTKMEWMQKAPEKLMAYMRWQKEEQARLDAAYPDSEAENARKRAANAKGLVELEKLKADNAEIKAANARKAAANAELRRVAEGLGKINAPCKPSSDGRCP